VLEILFEPDGKGTRITLIHTNIPENQAEGYEKGWEEFYFEPMKKYYGVISYK
jgi:activator of HSP90 ATPase